MVTEKTFFTLKLLIFKELYNLEVQGNYAT